MELVAAIEQYTRGTRDLPTLPGVAMRILEAVQDDHSGLKELADIVSTDPPLSAKILQIVNSPFFGFPTKIGSVNHAINLLGTSTVKNLSLGLSLVGAYRKGGSRSFDYSLFWKKSLMAATAAKKIAQRQMPGCEEDLFFLGLIHNIGELALAQCSADRYAEVAEYREINHCPLYEAESGVFGFNHMEIGEYLIRSWGLPESFSHAIRYHHTPHLLRTDGTEADRFARLLYLASLCADMFYEPDKDLLLKQFNDGAEALCQRDPIDLYQLLELVYEQTLHVFPVFDVSFDSEKQNLELTIRLQSSVRAHLTASPAGDARETNRGGNVTEIESMHDTGHVLVVDDEKRNLQLIEAMLVSDEYRVSRALSGKEALAIAEKSRLDVILLDVMMPEMDGFEVCRRLKLDPLTRPIPVLMVTALNKKEHRVRAMEFGADDFLNKPVDRTELLVRVRSLVRIKRYHDELKGSLDEIAVQNERLRELEKTKEHLIHMIIHDLNNPLAAITGNLELMLMDPDDLTVEHQQTLSDCTGFCRDLQMMIEELLLIHRMESGNLELQKERLDMRQVVGDLLAQFSARASEGDVRLTFTAPTHCPDVEVDPRIMRRVVANLIDNALRHTPAGGKVWVEADVQEAEGILKLNVCDTGNGLLPAQCETIFELYEQVKAKNNGAGGLGLAFCKMAVEAHNGKIRAESPGADRGTVFRIEMPA